jgi:hypothetical protein
MFEISPNAGERNQGAPCRRDSRGLYEVFTGSDLGRQVATILRERFDKLPGIERRVINLRTQNFSDRMIAASNGTTVANVQATFEQAINHLIEELPADLTHLKPAVDQLRSYLQQWRTETGNRAVLREPPLPRFGK